MCGRILNSTFPPLDQHVVSFFLHGKICDEYSIGGSGGQSEIRLLLSRVVPAPGPNRLPFVEAANKPVRLIGGGPQRVDNYCAEEDGTCPTDRRVDRPHEVGEPLPNLRATHRFPRRP